MKLVALRQVLGAVTFILFDDVPVHGVELLVPSDALKLPKQLGVLVSHRRVIVSAPDTRDKVAECDGHPWTLFSLQCDSSF